jgi:hypothetical protein
MLPAPSPTPASAPVPVMTAIRVTGSNVLRAVGETSQLTAHGMFSDGTTRDVTAEATWTSSNSSRFSVSAGTVTALSLGMGSISARFQNRSSGIQVFATAPNTYVFHGRAREPGLGGIPGVRVVDTMSNRSELTDLNGDYQFADLTTARFRFEKEGYEPAEVAPATPAATLSPGVFAEAALQRVVRIAAGSSMTGLQVAPHDLEYTIGSERCFPCKVIRVTTATAGRLRVDATWLGQANTLNVWLTGIRFRPSGSAVSAEATVDGGEILVYVGFNLPQNQSMGSYVAFNVSTTLAGS